MAATRGWRGSGDPRLPVDVQAWQPAADVAARIAELLGFAPVSVDELARLAEAPARQVRTVLIELELAGKVEWRGGDLVSSLIRWNDRRWPCLGRSLMLPIPNSHAWDGASQISRSCLARFVALR